MSRVATADAEFQSVVEHLVRLAYRSAAGGDRRRPHQLVETRVLAGELQVVVPARTDVVSDMVMDDGGDGALGLQECCPAEVEMVVEGRRGNARWQAGTRPVVPTWDT
jgi:hypothetical protein